MFFGHLFVWVLSYVYWRLVVESRFPKRLSFCQFQLTFYFRCAAVVFVLYGICIMLEAMETLSPVSCYSPWSGKVSWLSKFLKLLADRDIKF